MPKLLYLALLTSMATAALTLPAPPAGAQEEEPTLQDSLPSDVLKTPARFLTFTIENDLFGSGSDQNYTNGARLTYFDYGTEPPWFAKILDRYVPTFSINETTSTYYSLGQNLYTPKDILARTPAPKDRPYAAFLYASAGLTSLTDNHIDDLEATIGVVGPWAMGEQTQKFVHDIVNANDPSGWDHQLKNEPGLMISWERQWPAAYSTDIGGFNFRAAPHTGITLGNVYTYGAGGLSFQLTPQKYKWQSKPLRVRPAIPGNGYFAVPEDHFAWSLFAGLEERVMGRNIFLDGNTFRDSPSVDKKRLVTDANAGISFTYGKAQISYTLNWRSKEFFGQDDPSLFGAVSLGYRF
ncbi:MAG: lipid A deacylase LpxR family protein [Alphaproteobacteria bacterium]|nr:lipid A deacylase LpxR family protein [Alphaproteobacteria bacterium]